MDTSLKKIVRKTPIEEDNTFAVNSLIDPYFDPNYHSHPEYQLFVVLKGTGTRFIGDSIKTFSDGDMVFTGPNVPHMWRSDDKYFKGENGLITHGLVIYFNERFLGKHFLEKKETYKLKKVFRESARGIEIYGKTNTHITRLMKKLIQTEGLESIIILLKILDLLSNSAEIKPIASHWFDNSYKITDTQRMNKIQNYVIEHFKEKITLEEAASIANMRPTSFSRYFKSRANKTFSNFLSEIRIGHSCKLLREDNVSITQACFDSGFNTLSNFNKQFKEVTGKSPRRYREEYNEVY